MDKPRTANDALRQARTFERAVEIAREMRRGGAYQCFDNHDGTYLVVKQAFTNRVSDNSAYLVDTLNDRCTCPDWTDPTHQDYCKHTQAVDIMLTDIASDEANLQLVGLLDNAECAAGCDSKY